MNTPLRRAPRRSSYLTLVHSPETVEPDETFKISDRARQGGVIVDFTLRGFGKPRSDRRTAIVPGYGGPKLIYGPLREGFAEAEQGDTANIRQPRTKPFPYNILDPTEITDPAKLSKDSVAVMIDELRRRYPEQKVTLIGHSKGGVDVVDGALRRIDDVEDVVLLGSGGLEDGQSIGRLAKRTARIVRQEGRSLLRMRPDNSFRALSQAAFHMLRNPARTLGEGLEVGNRDIMASEISTLRRAGIGVHAVQLELDQIFPVAIAERDAAPLVDSFSVIEGLDHFGPQTHPEMVAEHISNTLSDFHRRSIINAV